MARVDKVLKIEIPQEEMESNLLLISETHTKLLPEVVAEEVLMIITRAVLIEGDNLAQLHLSIAEPKAYLW